MQEGRVIKDGPNGAQLRHFIAKGLSSTATMVEERESAIDSTTNYFREFYSRDAEVMSKSRGS